MRTPVAKKRRNLWLRLLEGNCPGVRFWIGMTDAHKVTQLTALGETRLFGQLVGTAHSHPVGACGASTTAEVPIGTSSTT